VECTSLTTGEGVLADRLQRNLFHLLAGRPARRFAEHAVHRTQIAFQPMQPGENVVAPRQRRGEGGAEPALRPFQQLGLQRVGEHEPQRAAGIAAGCALALQRQVEGQQFERRLQIAQLVHRHGGIGEGLAEFGEEGVVVETGQPLQRGQHRAASFAPGRGPAAARPAGCGEAGWQARSFQAPGEFEDGQIEHHHNDTDDQAIAAIRIGSNRR